MSGSILQKRIEEVILIFLILINLTEFFNLTPLTAIFGVFPGEIWFVKVIISTTGLGSVLYKANISKILFGEKHRRFDFLIILIYFSLLINKFIEFSFSAVLESKLFEDFFIQIISNSLLLETIGFILGNVMLLAVAFYAASSIEIKEPSTLNAIHADSSPGFFRRFLSLYLVLLALYLLFFNLVMEWFTLIIESTLVLFGLFFYLFQFHDLSKSMSNEQILFKIADFVETLFEGFIELFHSKKTLFLGISAILVLHPITDFFAYVIPQSTGMGTNIYIEKSISGENIERVSILSLLIKDMELSSGNQKIYLLFGYLLNFIGIGFLMLFPAFVWYILYIQKKKAIRLNTPPVFIALIYASLVQFIFLPSYIIRGITAYDKGIFGAEILIRSISVPELGQVIYGSAGVFIFIFILANLHTILRDLLFIVMSILNIIFFSYYLFIFINSRIMASLYLINTLLGENVFLSLFSNFTYGMGAAEFLRFFFIAYTALYIVISFFLYVVSFLVFIYSIFHKSEY